jgi:uncharacterized membrane protein
MGGELVDLTLRWLHLFAGIVWIGHNYVGLVLVPRFLPYDPGQDRQEVVTSSYMSRQSREHAVFRYASIVAWASGMLILWRQERLVDVLTLSGYDAPIGAGVWIGTIMMLNVWLVMWQHQKKVLGFAPATDEEKVRCSRITFLCARTNSMLSIPLLFLMAAGVHAPSLFD